MRCRSCRTAECVGAIVILTPATLMGNPNYSGACIFSIFGSPLFITQMGFRIYRSAIVRVQSTDSLAVVYAPLAVIKVCSHDLN